MSLDPPANSSIWDELSQDDKSEYLRIREEFRKNQKVSSKDRRVVTFRKELLTVLQFLERGTDNLETRCILTGICFAGPIVCVNTRQLKSFLCRCKSSINGSFQQLGYLALKTKSKTRHCVLAVLPSLLDHQNILRQWTVRVVSDEALFCFVSSFSKVKIPVKIEEEDLFFEKNAADSVPMPQLSRQFPMQMPFYQQQQQQQQQFNMMGMQYSYNPTMVNSLSQPNLQAYRFYPQPPIQPQQPQFNPCMNYYNPPQVIHTSNFMGHQNQIYSQQHQHRQRPQLQLFQEFQNQNLDQDQEQDSINSQTQSQDQTQSEQNKVHFVSHVKQNQHAVSFGAFVPPSSMPARSTTLYPYPLSREDESNQNCQQPFQVSVTPTVIDSDLESADSEFDTPPESETIQNDIADAFDNVGSFSSIQLNRSNDISRVETGHPSITTSFSMDRFKENHYHDVDFDFPQIEDKNTNDNENTNNNIEFDMNGNENENQDILEDIEPNPQFLSFIYPDQQKTLSRSQSAKIHFDNWDNFNDFF